MKLFLLCLTIALSGCTNTAAIIEAASHDPARVHMEIHTVYGTIVYDREMPLTNPQK